MLHRSSRFALIGATVLVASSLTTVLALRATPTPTPVRPPALGSELADLPLTFAEDGGPAGASFSVRGIGASATFTEEGLALSVRPDLEREASAELGLRLSGARPVKPTGLGRTAAVVTDLDATAEPMRTFSGVAYREPWPGIDVVYSGTSSRLKYRFVLEPGADPSRVALRWTGADGLSVNDRGQLEIATSAGTVIDDRPFTYQVSGGRRVEVPSSYRMASDGSVGFELGRFDPTRPLVIDPALLVYAGYIGGNSSDEGRGVAVDAAGNTYIAGETLSGETTFPDGDGVGGVPGFDTSLNGMSDAFVVKINAAGTALVYATFIGGTSFDVGRGIAVDASGSAYVTGWGGSDQSTFPDGDGFGGVPGFDQTHNGGNDSFVVKLNPAGTGLVYATFIGGAGFDRTQDVTIDTSGAAYVTGRTDSDETTFPDGDGFDGIPGFDTSQNGITDAFVVKLNPSGTGLSYATYLGGPSADLSFSVVPDATGSAYVAGFTASDQTTFPDGDGFGGVPGFDQTHNGFDDAFVVKLNGAGTALGYATFIGGSNDDHGFGIGIDPQGNAYMTGPTSSVESEFPDGDGFGSVPGFDQTYNNSQDAYVVGLNPAGTGLLYGTYVGGGNSDAAFGIATDPTGSSYIVGETTSDETTFPDGDGFGGVPGPDQTWNGGFDAFVAKVGDAGALVYAGYVGGSVQDNGYHVAVDPVRRAHIVGRTDSDQAEFPDGDGFGGLPSFDATHNGGTDAFAATIEAFPTITCRGANATVLGTEGDDVIAGTPATDVVVAFGGNDIVKALGGNDLVCSGDGNDKVSAGGGEGQGPR